jgi:hypothetical protein
MSKYILIIIILLSQKIKAQQLAELQLGGNFFETQSFGNNPLTLSSLVKNPIQLNNYISNFQHESVGGAGGFYSLNKNISISASFHLNKNNKLRKKLLFNLGISIGLEESHPTGFLSKRYTNTPSPQINQRIIETLNFSERRNYLGFIIGATYIFRPEKTLSFFSGIQYLHNFSVLHNYNSNIDKLTFTSTNSGPETGETLNYENRSWEGRAYSVQRLFVPLGISIRLTNKYFIRPAIQLGLYWPPEPFRITDESHGFSINLVKRF